MSQRNVRPTLEALRRSQRELERQIREKSAELEKTTKALQAEITGRERIEKELTARVRQQAAIAQIGQLALSGAELSVIMEHACALVARTLDVEFCKILELLPDGEALRLRAGVGWKEGSVGRAIVNAGIHSQAGYTLLSAAPVIAEDLRTETRFSGPPLLHDHGIVSGMSVIISGAGRPFGVLGAHTVKQRTFSRDDVYFLEAVANVLGEAIERKKAEDEIQRGTNWIQSLIDTTQDAVISIDRQGRIVLFNPAAERIFGYGRAEVQGKKVNILMAKPYGSEHDDYISRYERTGEARAIGRIRTVQARRKNGEIFPIELSVAEVKTDEEIRYGAFIRDISEKVKLQERSVEEERLAAIGATAAKLAHEISNPLSGMYMQVQAVEQRLVGQQLQRVETVQAIRLKMRSLRDEINRLHSLLDDFTSLSRRDKYSFRPTDVARLVAQVIEMEMENYRARGIGIRQDLASDLPRIHADRDRLKQALLNLCKNAMEAMPQGGQLTVRGARSEKQVIFEIIDTGVGIPPGIDIFEPFVTTKPKGTGLGLMTARQIILAHQGTITYTSGAGKGTSFKLILPLSPSPEH